MDDRLPWEKQKGESRQAFEAFSAYRDMGAARSLTKVAKKLNKSVTILGRWSGRWNWVERTSAWDIELDRQNREAQIEAIKEMSERHAREAMLFQQKVVERLRELRPGELSPQDMARWFEVAVKVERLSRGETTEILKQDIKQEVQGQVTQRHEYDITHQIEQYADVYRQLARRGVLCGSDAGDDTGEPLDTT